ncbi:MAG: nucleotidyltransferase domain-containing protein [Solirubrobacterales bacterium]
MARNWEETFSEWTGADTDYEQSRYENTRDAIRKALEQSPRLRDYPFKVYPKGSYPNYTNVVRDSDVDIAVELEEFNTNTFVGAAEGLTVSDVGLVPYTGGYTLRKFKDDVEAALIDAFGTTGVKRRDKAIELHQTTAGLKADVVPCVTHNGWTSQNTRRVGIRLQSDKNPDKRILNYPQQHLDEGVAKNQTCQRRYKRVVRILKRLENEMVERELISKVPSFLIESSVWNVPNGYFLVGDNWTERVTNAIAHIHHGTKSPECESSDAWLEANGIKYLFCGSQPWRADQMHEFAFEAFRYAELS